jgi:ABC-2 type transport system ATP-binding protein
MTKLVEISHLTKEFGNFKAVTDISFFVEKGEVLGFLGPNGAGKSTTMRMATGFLEPSHGEIIICGKNIALDPVGSRTHIGYLPEGGPLYPDMTPQSFLRFIGQLRGLNSDRLEERLAFVVDKLQISGVYNKTIDTLSKGYKRRVALAQAILHDPEVLILDEPTDGLDPNQKQDVRQLILDMASEKAIIISTHILEEVEAVCTRNVVIAKGKIVAEGTPEELAALSPEHQAVVVELASTAKTKREDIQTILKKLKHVETIRLQGTQSVVVIPKGGKDILADVQKAVSSHPISQVYRLPGQLETAFRAITKHL